MPERRIEEKLGLYKKSYFFTCEEGRAHCGCRGNLAGHAGLCRSCAARPAVCALFPEYLLPWPEERRCAYIGKQGGR